MQLEILQLLKRSPGTKYSYKEVGRIVDRRQYRDDLHWARPFLERLAIEQAISKDDTLYFFADSEKRGHDITPCVRSGGGVGPAATHDLTADATTVLKPLVSAEHSAPDCPERPTRPPATPEPKRDSPNRDRA